jgi:DNA invertase Pin-like site-specific DNA recombinase
MPRAKIKVKKAAGLVITKLDRLSRNMGDWNDLINGYFGEAAGKPLFSVGDSIDTRTAAGRFVLNILMSVAQWERKAIGERTRDALQHKKRRRETTGQVAFGWRLAEDGKSLVEDPVEQDAIAIVRELKAAGLSIRKIVAEMDARGFPQRRMDVGTSRPCKGSWGPRRPPARSTGNHPQEPTPGPALGVHGAHAP